MAFKLKPVAEQVIVITGASSGIGLATAYKAADSGARIVLVSRNGDALQRIESEILGKGGHAIHVVADVSKREDLERVAARAIEAFGGFDTWVNNAGVGIFGRLSEVSDADHRQLFEVNFWGFVYGTTIAAEHFKTKGGAIVNVSSVAADVGFPVQGMYSASKHAIKGFTDSFRMEMEEADAPISITSIKPASINTPFPAHAKNYLGGKPTLPPPVYQPEDVADAIVFAAEHGGRDYYVGSGAKMISSLNKHAPQMVDKVGSRMIPKMSILDEPMGRDAEGSLYQAGTGGEVHGDSNRLVRRSNYTQATLHPLLASTLVAGVGLAAAALLGRRDRS